MSSRLFTPLLLGFLFFFLSNQNAFSKEVPYLASRVNDYANILSPATIQQLERSLKEHEDSTSNQVVVLTVESLEGEVLEEFSIKVVDQWRLGTKKNDNGVLLLIAKDEHKVRIEVGDGLEGVLTDGICGAIIRQHIVPFFKEQRFDDGVQAGITAILKAIKVEYTADEESADTIDGVPWPFNLLVFLFFLSVVGVFTTIALLSKGFATWFLYLFLTPFWLAFPIGIWGFVPGATIYGVYAIGFLFARLYFAKNNNGQELFKKWSKHFQSSGSGSGSGTGWGSSSSSWSSSSGSSFSGGGGSFSGGGSSGSW